MVPGAGDGVRVEPRCPACLSTGRELSASEAGLRENQARLQASNQQISNLAGRLIASQETERARIARDLHDDLSQQIAGLSIALSALKHRLAGLGLQHGDELGSEVSSLQQRTAGLADNIRNLSHELHPSVLRHAGLTAALAAFCADVERQKKITITFTPEGDFASVSADTALCLYRITQEALRNVVTHAQATRADVRLRRIHDSADLTIVDDGRGFDIASRHGQGLGLISIDERVRLAGGTVSIVTEKNSERACTSRFLRTYANPSRHEPEVNRRQCAGRWRTRPVPRWSAGRGRPSFRICGSRPSGSTG